jgi:hypothetical protein
VLVECGFVRATADDGSEWTFAPSLARIAALGNPREIVELYAQLHDPQRAEQAARYILASLCEQDDPTPLVGWLCADDGTEHAGLMPTAEQIIIARHLMQHGIAGNDRPGAGAGRYVSEFKAAEYIAVARVHLGLSTADAEALSMTELQGLLDAKFPDKDKASDVPTREEYEAGMIAMRAIQKAAAAKPKPEGKRGG